MANLVIETYENGKLDTTIRIPVLVARMALKLIPKKAFQAMENEGMNISEILEAAKSGEVTGRLIEIDDHKDNEKLVISVSE